MGISRIWELKCVKTCRTTLKNKPIFNFLMKGERLESKCNICDMWKYCMWWENVRFDEARKVARIVTVKNENEIQWHLDESIVGIPLNDMCRLDRSPWSNLCCKYKDRHQKHSVVRANTVHRQLYLIGTEHKYPVSPVLCRHSKLQNCLHKYIAVLLKNWSPCALRGCLHNCLHR